MRLPWLRPRGLRSSEAEARLRGLLATAGVDVGAPSAADVDRTWSVMQGFAHERVVDLAPPEDDGDLLLAQYGTYDWGHGEWFELDLTRQFIFNDRRGEYLRMSQLRCVFEFEPTERLRELGADDLWSSDGGVDDFFAQALTLTGFAFVREQELKPQRLRVDYGWV